jgi:hypothetical protein
MNLTAYPQFNPTSAQCESMTVPLHPILLTLYLYEFALVAIQ